MDKEQARRAVLAHTWFVSAMRAGMLMIPVLLIAAEMRDSPSSGDKSTGDSLRLVAIWLLLTGALRVVRSLQAAFADSDEKTPSRSITPV